MTGTILLLIVSAIFFGCALIVNAISSVGGGLKKIAISSTYPTGHDLNVNLFTGKIQNACSIVSEAKGQPFEIKLTYESVEPLK